MENTLIIVTGSSGFIGSNLINKILNFVKNKTTDKKTYIIVGIDLLQSKIIDNNYIHLQNDIYTDKEIIFQFISDIIQLEDVDTIITCHLAAKISVDESMRDPGTYYNNNLVGTLNILEIIRKLNITNKYILFASTAAVYNPNYIDNKQLDIINPESIYGHTKLLSEQLIERYNRLFNIKSIVFRFFNVAGGRDTKEAHHLIPILIDRALKKQEWKIFGNDYDTNDGTCIRDYIHVNDIINAFMLTINNLNNIFTNNINDNNINNGNINNNIIMNLGSNKGYSVLDIINNTKEIINNNYNNIKIPNVNFTGRRPGDSKILISNLFDKNTYDPKELIGWIPECDIEDIIEDTIKNYLNII